METYAERKPVGSPRRYRATPRDDFIHEGCENKKTFLKNKKIKKMFLLSTSL